MKTGDLIKQRRKELRLTMKEVADFVGVSEATVSRWETGNIANMGRDKIASLAEILKLSPSVIAGYGSDDELKPPTIAKHTVTYPVLGEIPAGFEHIGIEDWNGETIEVPDSYLKGKDYNDYCVLTVKGDSMYPLYQEGDKVLVLKQNVTDYNSQIAAVIYDDEKATLKKVEINKDFVRLVPVNPEYVPKKITGEELHHFRILGVPKYLVREISE